MASPLRQIFAFSGVLDSADEEGSLALVEHALGLAARADPDHRGPGHREPGHGGPDHGGPDSHQPTRVCYIPTAVGDAQAAIDFYEDRFAGRPDARLSVLRLFTQPNVPDVAAHLLGQDLILVEGGSVVNLMAVWRAHGLPRILRRCWRAGVVLAGASAGSLCWHVGGPTDSYRDGLDPFTGGLGLVPYSNGVHDDFPGQPRREAYRALVAQGV
ncbi:MAG TPA: Type 1 glutamine amidotransferase-like domain-containing protein, partial [Streptosporangiaceae bacterium]